MINPPKRTGIVQDQRYADHCTDPDHPECSDRLEVLSSMVQAPDMRKHFTVIDTTES